jgi:hypothetical protein
VARNVESRGAYFRPVSPLAPSDWENRLRDIGWISFLLGLLLLNVAFAVLFTGPPQPGITNAGLILTTIGAAALAIRYRFAAILLVCFLTPIAIVAAFVAWPPAILALLALPILWVIARRWRRSPSSR